MKNRSEVKYLVLISLSLTVVLAVYNGNYSLKRVSANSLYVVNNPLHKSVTSIIPSFSEGCNKNIQTLHINDILLLDIINTIEQPLPHPFITGFSNVIRLFVNLKNSFNNDNSDAYFNAYNFPKISDFQFAGFINIGNNSIFSGFLPVEQPVRAGPAYFII